MAQMALGTFLVYDLNEEQTMLISVQDVVVLLI